MVENPGTAGEEPALLALCRAIDCGERAPVARTLALNPTLAQLSVRTGATRQSVSSYYLEHIAHYVYAGDTALHIAAAAYAVDIAEELISRGALIRAANRRGAEPLHYAADGIPGSPNWKPDAQVKTVALLFEAGADSNARDKDGATPLHRAVRTRCAEAVRALLANGSAARSRNKAGSSALHLAVQNTGRGGTGSPEAQAQQRQIIELLLAHGALVSDRDDKGKSVIDCAKSAWIRELLEGAR